MQEICQDYWSPIYAYLRHQGHPEEDAKDLTQGFFQHVIRSNVISHAEQSKGRLRSYLHTCLLNFLVSSQRRRMSAKRGGNVSIISLINAEELYANEASDHFSPDVVFQRRWALNVIERAMENLARKYAQRGSAELFDALRPYLCESETAVGAAGSMPQIAQRLGMTHSALRVALHRCRESLQNCIYHEVGQTIASENPEAIRAEIRLLLDAL